MYDILIKNGIVVDGTGSDGFEADVAVKDGIIAKVGKNIDLDAKKVIDAKGKTITPGFIDSHSHGDLTAPFYPDMESPLGQGITTIFTGHCGLGMAPVDTYWMEMCAEEEALSKIYPRSLKGHGPGFDRVVKTDDLVAPVKEVMGADLDWRSYKEFASHLRKSGLGVNIVHCIGHAPIRTEVMGSDYKRKATPEEVKKMCDLLARCFEEGAFGFSFGLDYNPGIYAGDDELLELAKVCAKYDRILTAHVRMHADRDNPEAPHAIIDGIREFLEIGLKSKARLHISHIMNGYKVYPYDPEMDIFSAKRTLEVIEEYRKKGVKVNWDVLPKKTIAAFNNIELSFKVFPYLTLAGGKHNFLKAIKNEEYLNKIKAEIRAGKCPAVSSGLSINPVKFPDWDKGFYFTVCKVPGIEGKSMAEAAKFLNMDSVDAYFEILSQDVDARVATFYHDNNDGKDFFCKHEEASLGLDNVAFNYDCEFTYDDMPTKSTQSAAFCGMIKYICYDLDGRFETTIKHITGTAATKIGLNDRGFIKEGMAADIVVLDRAKLDPNENRAHPATHPKGIDYVIVNGKLSLEGDKFTHVRSGLMIDKGE